MKRAIIPIFNLFFLYSSFGQIGIGTENPEVDLDVNGSMLVQEKFNLGRLGTVRTVDEDFKLLTRISNSDPKGKITVLNVDSLKVAPINVVNYEFKNLNLDKLKEVDLQYDADRYIVALSNFQYIGYPIRKRTVAGRESIGAFVYRVYVKENRWHIEIRNRFLDLEREKTVTYKATLIVYDKSYFRHLPVITTNLNGENSGNADRAPSFNN